MALNQRRWTDVPLHVLDFEGGPRTGVVEFGVATLLGGEVISVQTGLCAPLAPIPAIDTQCHGLADLDLEGHRSFDAQWERFVSLRASGVLAAHNSPVEARLLASTWPHPSAVPSVAEEGVAQAEWGPWVDTLRLARIWAPSLGDFRLAELVRILRLADKLDAMAARHCPVGRRRFHCAGYDALAAALLLRYLGGLEGRSALPLGRLLADSLGGAEGGDFHQGELGL
ncbi:MAG: 3'-5' exonuclease [Opitutales bacterium]